MTKPTKQLVDDSVRALVNVFGRPSGPLLRTFCASRRYTELGLHLLSSRLTVYVLRQIGHFCIPDRVCDARAAVGDAGDFVRGGVLS